MSIPEQAGKVAGGIIDTMKGTPMILALLLINVCFLGAVVYLMGEAVANSAERNKQQLGLIEKLVTDIRDCRQGPRNGRYDPTAKSLIRIVP